MKIHTLVLVYKGIIVDCWTFSNEELTTKIAFNIKAQYEIQDNNHYQNYELKEFITKLDNTKI